MALAALAGMATGCTGDDDDDDDAGPGGVMVLGRTSSDGLSASYSYAEFYSDFVGTPSSVRDIPLDGCIDAFATSTSGTPTYLDVGATATATGAATATYDREISGTDIEYFMAADVPGAAGDYAAATETFGALGTISVPADPGSVTGAAAGAVTWTAGSSDETLLLIAATDFSQANLCRTANDGSYTVPFATLGLTSGLAGITVLNFGEADLEGRTVSLVGQSGDPTFDMSLWTD